MFDGGLLVVPFSDCSSTNVSFGWSVGAGTVRDAAHPGVGLFPEFVLNVKNC